MSGPCRKRIRRWAGQVLAAKLSRPIRRELTSVDSFRLDLSQIDRDSVIYSCGVGPSIDFEFALNRRFGCGVELFDPAPQAIAYVGSQPIIRGLHFTPTGVWNVDRSTRFYYDAYATNTAESRRASAGNWHNQSSYFEAEAKTLQSLMHERDHSHIDVLKLDIEGGAALVLHRAFDDGVFPSQIVARLEQPDQWSAINAFCDQTAGLCERLEALGYDLDLQQSPDEQEATLLLTAIQAPQTESPLSDTRSTQTSKPGVAPELATACP